MDSELEAVTLKRPGTILHLEEAKKQNISDDEKVANVAKNDFVKKEEELEEKKPILKWNRRKRQQRKD